MNRRPILTSQRFDDMLARHRDVTRDGRNRAVPSLAAESLWGAQAIADFMNVSDDFVRKLARKGEAPIRIRGGRYFSTRTEIVTWLMPGSEESRKGTA